MSLVGTILRETFARRPLDRVPEPELVTTAPDAVSAFAAAGRAGGVLSGVYAFLAEQAGRLIRPGDRVLDLGCGPATLLSDIAGRHPRAAFVGVDLSSEMIERGRRELRTHGRTNVELRVEDMTRLDSTASGSIDVVLSSMAFHHLAGDADLRRCLAAAARVMKPAAEMFVADFGRLGSARSIDYFVRRAIPAGEDELARDYRASLHAAFTPAELWSSVPAALRPRLAVYSTAVSPMMVALRTRGTGGPTPARTANGDRNEKRSGNLPWRRRLDYWQLRLFFRMGGLPG